MSDTFFGSLDLVFNSLKFGYDKIVKDSYKDLKNNVAADIYFTN